MKSNSERLSILIHDLRCSEQDLFADVLLSAWNEIPEFASEFTEVEVFRSIIKEIIETLPEEFKALSGIEMNGHLVVHLGDIRYSQRSMLL